jgi:hypothetical protein
MFFSLSTLFSSGGLIVHRLPHVGGKPERGSAIPIKGIRKGVLHTLPAQAKRPAVNGLLTVKEVFGLISDGQDMIHSIFSFQGQCRLRAPVTARAGFEGDKSTPPDTDIVPHYNEDCKSFFQILSDSSLCTKEFSGFSSIKNFVHFAY